MIGTIKINLWIGCIASFVTLLTALSGNVFIVSIERAVYAFLLFFIAMFPIRWGIGLLLPQTIETADESTSRADIQQAGSENPEDHSDEGRATQPEVESDSDNEPSDDFTPLVPKRIEPTSPNNNPDKDPLEIADVIRRLTDE